MRKGRLKFTAEDEFYIRLEMLKNGQWVQAAHGDWFEVCDAAGDGGDGGSIGVIVNEEPYHMDYLPRCMITGAERSRPTDELRLDKERLDFLELHGCEEHIEPDNYIKYWSTQTRQESTTLRDALDLDIAITKQQNKTKQK